MRARVQVLVPTATPTDPRPILPQRGFILVATTLMISITVWARCHRRLLVVQIVSEGAAEGAVISPLTRQPRPLLDRRRTDLLIR